MTPNKAREFYSDYLEGTLEGGLRESFERALARDAELQYDFDSFKEAMNRLSAVDTSEVAAPAGLFEQISLRVDQSFPSQAPKPRLWLIENLRPLLAVGAAASVIALAVISIQNNEGGGPSTSNMTTVAKAMPPTIARQGSQALFSYRPPSEDTLTFKDGESGEVLLSRVVGKGELFSEPLANPRLEAGIVIIQLSSQPEPIRIAVPGRMSSAPLQSEGTVMELAKVLCSSFKRPVKLEVKNPDRSIKWKLEEGASVPQVSLNLKALDLTLDEMRTGVLVLTDG